ncbi:MAG: hypothetical protein QW373_06495 [Desulfurococcaceae archaeon]
MSVKEGRAYKVCFVEDQAVSTNDVSNGYSAVGVGVLFALRENLLRIDEK